eukprot:comp18162_c0_seq1/m.18942 comp18162_c0_seq1/g.18942  ORF comp18162_c0_seq1/g.18942 comp18162_c0_seq1/m.18942 type:complete len:327 (-) comp18162_c0_seq1:694-1674(-)
MEWNIASATWLASNTAMTSRILPTGEWGMNLDTTRLTCARHMRTCTVTISPGTWIPTMNMKWTTSTTMHPPHTTTTAPDMTAPLALVHVANTTQPPKPHTIMTLVTSIPPSHPTRPVCPGPTHFLRRLIRRMATSATHRAIVIHPPTKERRTVPRRTDLQEWSLRIVITTTKALAQDMSLTTGGRSVTACHHQTPPIIGLQMENGRESITHAVAGMSSNMVGDTTRLENTTKGWSRMRQEGRRGGIPHTCIACAAPARTVPMFMVIATHRTTGPKNGLSLKGMFGRWLWRRTRGNMKGKGVDREGQRTCRPELFWNSRTHVVTGTR